MSMITQRTDFRPQLLPNGAGDARRNPAAHGWPRRLLWLVAGSTLVLMGLLAPVLVKREPVEPATGQRSSQPAGAEQATWRGSDTTTTTSHRGDQLFLPLIVRSQSQDARLSDLSPTLGSHSVAGQPPRNAERAPIAAAATDHRLFLATVMRGEDVTSQPASTTVSAASQAEPTKAGGALFLPLVANTLAPVANTPTIQPQLPGNAIAIPTALPTLVPTATPTTPPIAPVVPLFTLPTPASAQVQQVQTQIQALLNEVNDLIERGVLPAAEGQPLLRQLRVVMRLPVFTLGVAPSTPSPGQSQPEVQQLQLFIDHVDHLIARGLLPAGQGQSLLDQARAISQALGGG